MAGKIVFKPVYLPENRGLGNALEKALTNCSFNLIARMDSDDISVPFRFEIQLKTFIANPNLDIVGSSITEFVDFPENITGERTVELSDIDIKNDMRKRCAMNHVSVMYKKDAVLSSGGYLDWYCNEDYYLWIRMMEHGCRFANVPYPLVNVRTGSGMSARRGGWKYFRSEQTLQKYMFQKKLIGLPRYICNVMVRFGGECVATNSMRQIIYKILRQKYDATASGQMKKPNPENNEKTIVYPPFSVAISVYGKDNPKWFDLALDSVINQTVKPSEIVLVVDGAIPKEIQTVIEKYSRICRAAE